MTFAWEKIGDKIYGLLASAGYGIQMRDENGAATMDPHKAIRFLATIKSQNPQLDTFNVLIGLHDEDSYSHLDFRTPKQISEKDFETVTSLKNSIQKNLGDVEGLKINWTPFGSAITLKDDPIKKVTESKDISRVYGTTKSSFQRVGESKIIIRHTDAIDESKQGSRWRKIRAVFIETQDGERFKYARPHVCGARAMARHLSEGGNINDVTGQSIARMSEDYMQLKHASKLLRDSGLHVDAKAARTAMKNINRSLRKVSGPRGYRGIGDMLATQGDHDIQRAHEKSKGFLTDCQCVDDTDSAALNTAARYIIQVTVPNDSQNTNIPKWLAPMLQKIANRLSDGEHRDRINTMSNDVNAGKMPDIDDVKWASSIAPNLKENIIMDSIDEGNFKLFGFLNKSSLDLKSRQSINMKQLLDILARNPTDERHIQLKRIKMSSILADIAIDNGNYKDMNTELLPFKKIIIVSLLEDMKRNGSNSVTKLAIEGLKKLKIEWPELDIIKKSIVHDSNIVRENVEITRLKKLSGL